ncbi:hypothetical protein [Streptomyces sp. NPDC003032]
MSPSTTTGSRKLADGRRGCAAHPSEAFPTGHFLLTLIPEAYEGTGEAVHL